MLRFASLAALAAAVSLSACQPAKTPEQIAAENAARAMQEMAAAFGAAGAGGPNAQLDPNQMAAALAQAGAMASAMDPDMTAEDRAKLQAISGALASGQVHPAASAYVTGLNKVSALMGTIRDEASLNAVKPQVAAVYAEMAGPAATLKAMTEDQRDVAFGSALPQFMTFSMNMASVMIPLTSNPDLAEKVSDLMNDMPSPD